MSKIWIDVTYFMQWARPPVGIIRVERELIKWSTENLTNVGYFEFRDHQFHPVELKTVLLQLSRQQVQDNKKQSKVKLRNFFKIPNWMEFKHFVKGLALINYQFFLCFINSSIHRNINLFIKKIILPKKINKVSQEKSIKISDTSAALFENGDVILCAGMTWNYYTIHDVILDLKKMKQIKYMAICHDLIPIKFPNLCVVQPETFISYFRKLALCADQVVCISKSTENDYRQFVEQSKITAAPTTVIFEGCEPYQSHGSLSEPIKDLTNETYILFVSTIERRKNHEGLYKAILYLLENNQTQLPKFVFVGMKGWGVNDLLNDIALNPLVKKQIIILSEVHDSELSVLYQNCLSPFILLFMKVGGTYLLPNHYIMAKWRLFPPPLHYLKWWPMS